MKPTENNRNAEVLKSVEVTPKTPQFSFLTYLHFSTFSPTYGDELRQAMQGILPVTGQCITIALEIKIFSLQYMQYEIFKAAA